MPLTSAPAWAQRQLEGLVAAIIVLRHEGDQTRYNYLLEDANAIIDYYGLDRDAIFNMYGDPADPDTIEKARRVVANPPTMRGPELGIREVPTGRFGTSLCRARHIAPGPRQGTVQGFIYDEETRRGVPYEVVFRKGQFRFVEFGPCVKLVGFEAVMEAVEADLTGRENWRLICAETLNWSTAVEMILEDLPPRSAAARKGFTRMLVDATQRRCFKKL